jgi:hypothetical protein
VLWPPHAEQQTAFSDTVRQGRKRQSPHWLCPLLQVALKVALVDTPAASRDAPCNSQLAREAQLLQQLKQKAGIPTLRKFGEHACSPIWLLCPYPATFS